MNKILEFRDVEFSYIDNPIFSSVNFSLYRGEFVALFGHNGAGKSTLTKLALGLLKPKRGEIFLFGKNLAAFSEWKKIGYVPQSKELDLDFPISVLDLVLMGTLKSKPGLFKFYSSEDYIKSIEALKLLDLQDLKSRKLSELSGGQRQKIFLAQALVSSPEFLILDEPTSNLDFSSEHLFYQELSRLNKNGITIFLISHDIGQILDYASRILILNKKIVFDKPTSKLSKEEILSMVGKI
ncbi:MAG: metal ABC transporter ATP-binding protein [Candidatus Anstonellaceae archaeon]